MKNVREILPDVYRLAADKNSSDQELVLAYWPVTVGESVAEHTRPVTLLGKRLVVDVDGIAWRRQLAGMSRIIASKLNRAIGRQVVEAIDFRVTAPKRRSIAQSSSATGLDSVADDAAGIADAVLRRLYRISKQRRAK